MSANGNYAVEDCYDDENSGISRIYWWTAGFKLYFRGLSAQLPAAYVVVQHLLPEFVTYFAEHLAKGGVSFQVQVATDGLILEPGIVAIAPPLTFTYWFKRQTSLQ